MMSTHTTTPASKDVVLTATEQLLGQRDTSALDSLFSPDFVQHSTTVGGGLEGLRTFVAGLPGQFRYEQVRVLAEGDLVVTHGRYHGCGAAAGHLRPVARRRRTHRRALGRCPA